MGLHLIFFHLFFASPNAQELPSLLQARLPEFQKHAEMLAKTPELIAAVKARNQTTPDTLRRMDNTKWKKLSPRAMEVLALKENDVVKALKKKSAPYVSELFVSAGDGTKVCFYEKTTFWNHRGKQKFDDPIRGKIWIGDLEVDESSGKNQFQIGVPVRDGQSVIGALVIGISASIALEGTQ